MKEIRAFIRQHRIADVLQALRESGLCDLGTAGAGCHNIRRSSAIADHCSAPSASARGFGSGFRSSSHATSAAAPNASAPSSHTGQPLASTSVPLR